MADNFDKFCFAATMVQETRKHYPLGETHLNVVRGLIQLRGFNQCINKKALSQ